MASRNGQSAAASELDDWERDDLSTPFERMSVRHPNVPVRPQQQPQYSYQQQQYQYQHQHRAQTAPAWSSRDQSSGGSRSSSPGSAGWGDSEWERRGSTGYNSPRTGGNEYQRNAIPTEESNRRIWQSANTAPPTAFSILNSNISSSPVTLLSASSSTVAPPPKITLLKRPQGSQSTSPNSSRSSTPTRNKTVQEREEEYRLARERIMGPSYMPSLSTTTSSTTDSNFSAGNANNNDNNTTNSNFKREKSPKSVSPSSYPTASNGSRQPQQPKEKEKVFGATRQPQGPASSGGTGFGNRRNPPPQAQVIPKGTAKKDTFGY